MRVTWDQWVAGLTVLAALLGSMAVAPRFSPREAGAEIYKWVDKEGNVHFSNIARPKRSLSGVEVRPERPGPPRLPAEAQSSRPESSRNATVYFERRQAAIVVSAVVNQRYPAKFIVDTGATYTVVSREFARRLQLEEEDDERRVRLNTAAGTITAPLVSIGSVRVGGAEVRNVLAAIHSIGAPGGVVGVLGLSFLSAFRITIDHEEGRLSLQRHP